MKVDNEVLGVLDKATTTGKALVLNGQLDRKLYERTTKVLEAAGGKWNRSAKAHLFGSDAADCMEQIILTGEVTIPQDFGYFPTPPAVVRRVMELAEISDDMLVLEPSAGQGNLAVAASKQANGVMVDAIELLSKNVDALIELNSHLSGIQEADFLALTPKAIYDRVVMNPPFAKQDDIRHVLHALKFLKPDGLLVSVMPSSVTFRDNKLTTEFRALIRQRGGDIEALPEGSFKESGTAVNTVIVTIPGELT